MNVSIRGLRHARGGRPVLDVDALDFPAGTVSAVFGPNGAGKTTLLRCIAGLEPVRSDTVLLEGVTSAALAARRNVAFAFQQAVFLHATVRQNLELGLSLRRVPHEEREARVRDAAQACGVEHVLSRPAHRLSAGEAQRANLARALALRAPLTLLDEPLAGMDQAAREQLLFELPQILARHATTVILVTHDREEAFRIADRLVVLVDGRVRAAGEKRSVFGAPHDPHAAELLGYAVLESTDGELLAVQPTALRLAVAGSFRFELVAERVLDFGGERRVLCSDGRRRVEIVLIDAQQPPAPGARVVASADRAIRLRPREI